MNDSVETMQAIEPDHTSRGRHSVCVRRADGTERVIYYAAEGSEPEIISHGAGNNWCPDIACLDNGGAAVVWDGYGAGSYRRVCPFYPARRDVGGYPAVDRR